MGIVYVNIYPCAWVNGMHDINIDIDIYVYDTGIVYTHIYTPAPGWAVYR